MLPHSNLPNGNIAVRNLLKILFRNLGPVYVMS
jgi:hypothetical protein